MVPEDASNLEEAERIKGTVERVYGTFLLLKSKTGNLRVDYIKWYGKEDKDKQESIAGKLKALEEKNVFVTVKERVYNNGVPIIIPYKIRKYAGKDIPLSEEANSSMS